MERRLEFRYGRELVVRRILFAGIVGGLLGILVAVMPSPATPFVLLTVAVVAAYVVVFGVTPILTGHWLTRSRVILRQGWYFRAIVPMSDIVSLGTPEDGFLGQVPLGIHRPLVRPVLYVTGGRQGLVVLRLRRARRFWQAFGLMAREIVFDVDDRTRLLEAFEERRRLLSPVEPERADA